MKASKLHPLTWPTRKSAIAERHMIAVYNTFIIYLPQPLLKPDSDSQQTCGFASCELHCRSDKLSAGSQQNTKTVKGRVRKIHGEWYRRDLGTFHIRSLSLGSTQIHMGTSRFLIARCGYSRVWNWNSTGDWTHEHKSAALDTRHCKKTCSSSYKHLLSFPPSLRGGYHISNLSL